MKPVKTKVLYDLGRKGSSFVTLLTYGKEFRRSHDDSKPLYWRYDIFDSGSSCTLSEEEYNEDVVVLSFA